MWLAPVSQKPPGKTRKQKTDEQRLEVVVHRRPDLPGAKLASLFEGPVEVRETTSKTTIAVCVCVSSLLVGKLTVACNSSWNDLDAKAPI